MIDPSSELSRRAEREAMVREQLEARGLHDERVLAAMRTVQREAFVPPSKASAAYADGALDLEFGQTVSQPFMVALSSSLAQIRHGDRVLEIGTGSGYQAAVLAQLAGHVVSIERLAPLAMSAQAKLAELSIHNVTVLVGDGTLGSPDHAPFHAIVVTAGAPVVPRALVDQLCVGGRLIVPVGPREQQRLLIVEKTGTNSTREIDAGGCRYVPLVGAQGWATS